MRIHDVSVGAGDESHDLVIASCGYESRSSYVCRLGIRAEQMIALDYGGANRSYLRNRQIYTRNNWKIVDRRDLWATLAGIGDTRRVRNILVDISSMPRVVIAEVVQFFSNAKSAPDITFVYAPGKFEQSSKAAERKEALAAEPISDYFAGELRPTSVPIGLVVGLGLEQYRALGVMELLEPAYTWIFTTYTGDSRFREAAEGVHRRLLETFDPAAVFEYDVRSIADTVAALESLSFSAGLRYRLIMAPSGPKVFALASLLVGATRSSARPAIWRVGGAGSPQEFEIEEAGDLVAARVRFEVNALGTDRRPVL